MLSAFIIPCISSSMWIWTDLPRNAFFQNVFFPCACSVAQSCLTLCDPIDCSLPDASVRGIIQARILEWLPFPSPMHVCMLSHFSHVWFCATLWTAAHQAPLSTGSSRQEYWSGLPFPSPPCHSAIAAAAAAKSLQSCLTLCDPMDYSPSGSSFHGIFQARILEWLPFFFFRGSSQPRNWTQGSNPGLLCCRQILYCLSH